RCVLMEVHAAAERVLRPGDLRRHSRRQGSEGAGEESASRRVVEPRCPRARGAPCGDSLGGTRARRRRWIVDRLRALLGLGARSAAALPARGQGAGDIERRTITLVNALYQATDDADRERLAGELGELYHELLGVVQSSGRADERTRRAFVL